MKVQVRIALAIDSNGVWHAVGWSDEDGSQVGDEFMMETALEGVGEGENRFFLVAEVEAPDRIKDAPTVLASVNHNGDDDV